MCCEELLSATAWVTVAEMSSLGAPLFVLGPADGRRIATGDVDVFDVAVGGVVTTYVRVDLLPRSGLRSTFVPSNELRQHGRSATIARVLELLLVWYTPPIAE